MFVDSSGPPCIYIIIIIITDKKRLIRGLLDGDRGCLQNAQTFENMMIDDCLHADLKYKFR